MKIVIDGRMINESGIGRYLQNLIAELQKLDRENEYLILLLREDYQKLHFENNFKKVLADFRWYTVTEQLKLPRILHDIKPDLVHFPHFNVPILYEGKFIVTIHDLIHQHYSISDSSTHGKLIFNVKKIGYKKIFGVAVRKSEKILVPSEFVRQQLITEWRVSDSKIVVTHEGVNLIHPGGGLSRHSVKSPYILYVGNAHPHKNIEGLIKAFKILKKFKDDDLRLVLVGKENYFWKKIKQSLAASPLKKNIIFTGYVSDNELGVLYKKAAVYVEPGFEEGFGLPLLEAFSLGCPVVASDIDSLKEVGGEAALYFDPNNIEDMANKIMYVLNNVRLRNELIGKGKKRVKLFSWKKMAEQTLEVYEQAI